MQYDVIIVGGGPAGLAFARSLDDMGLETLLVERQPHAALADPAYDGREIALTHGSRAILERLGAWQRLPESRISPLQAARVRNGRSAFALDFEPGPNGEALGWLVPNHLIRRALFETIADQPGLRLACGSSLVSARADRRFAEVSLSTGERVRGRLLVAADSRFSPVREALGISAEVNRLGSAMLVCRVSHPKPHGQVATEWFGHGQTMALLPLNGGMSSVVLTLPEREIAVLATMCDTALGVELTRRSANLLGPMEVAGSRHVYPLATTWAKHFGTHRAALIGDAAVGMHPVTAHGFNLGLSGQALLAAEVGEAVRRGRDPGGDPVIRAYEEGHRAAARPLYLGTNFLVTLYTDERPIARAVRHAGLRIGARLPVFRSGVRSMLMAR
ncbi:5-demethoxyubiquinol-8 5-hydroxylase UbiM [Sphingomonas sp. HITSZ_GF]|uniref:5-demethoxyubiquinol-8 5-hydroxylase UbiM n=1 Tax=Sphingomonas sp. HITSZ_GF TaxID=3037247 RepID=UPI00240DB308|nr:5-demethoxyubiquinol-8 5-hydroxylase UbiM [Sphingomonas sp. HITSZ_GF]MDG2532174.1 5-demethoxyubiquinol-8 5-hydroxylase UbiM [Sphingomonas sp. HITSZ_GF]